VQPWKGIYLFAFFMDRPGGRHRKALLVDRKAFLVDGADAPCSL